MKPHSNLHALSNPLRALQGINGHLGLMQDAGKDALLLDAADTGFAGIMAQQLAQVTSEEPVSGAEHQTPPPVDAAPLQEVAEQGAAVAVMAEQAVPTLLNLPVEPKATVQVQASSDVIPTAARTTDAVSLTSAHGTSFAGSSGVFQPALDAPTEKSTPVFAGASASAVSSASVVRSTLADTERRTASSSAASSIVGGQDTGLSLDASTLANHLDAPRHGMPSLPMPHRPDGRPAMIDVPGSSSVRLPQPSPQTTHAEAVETVTAAGPGTLQTQSADVWKAAPSDALAQPKDVPALSAHAAQAKAPGNVPLPMAGSVQSETVLPGALKAMSALTSAVPQVASPLTLGAMLATARGVTRSAPSTVEAVTLRSIQRSTDASHEGAQPLQNQFLTKFANAVDDALLPQTPSMPMATTSAPLGGALPEAARPQPDQVMPGYDSTSMPTGLGLPTVFAQAFQQPIHHEVASLQQTVGTAAFADELIGQVNVWVKQSAQEGPMTAELHLNPADMGPVLIRIEVDGNLAQVNFAAQQADTRQAIESSMAMLSASLKEAGIQLSGSGVSDQGAPSQQAWGFDGRGEGGQPRQSSQAFAMAAQENQSTLKGATAPEQEPWRPTSPSRPGSSASGLDLYA